MQEQKKLEIHYKTVTEAREVLEKRMTELDSVIASLTEQLKESISISAEELNAQKENFAQQKKSLSENRDEIHARLEINSDMYEKIRRQQTELLKTWESERKTCFFITHDVDEAIILAQRVIVMSARPGRIKDIVDIDIPYPRDQETKMSPRFMELKNHIWSQVYQEYLEVRK